MGLNKGSPSEQLEVFIEPLFKAFYSGAKMAVPENWMYVLHQLALAIDSTGKNDQIVLFFDELLWLATRKSNFLRALEYF